MIKQVKDLTIEEIISLNGQLVKVQQTFTKHTYALNCDTGMFELEDYIDTNTGERQMDDIADTNSSKEERTDKVKKFTFKNGSVYLNATSIVAISELNDKVTIMLNSRTTDLSFDKEDCEYQELIDWWTYWNNKIMR